MEDRYDIRTIQELLGYSDVSTTMVYTHVLNRGAEAFGAPWTSGDDERLAEAGGCVAREGARR